MKGLMILLILQKDMTLLILQIVMKRLLLSNILKLLIIGMELNHTQYSPPEMETLLKMTKISKELAQYVQNNQHLNSEEDHPSNQHKHIIHLELIYVIIMTSMKNKNINTTTAKMKVLF